MKIKGVASLYSWPSLEKVTFHSSLDLGGLKGGEEGGGGSGPIGAGFNHIRIDCSLFSMSKEAICFNMKPNYYFARNNLHFLLRLKAALLTQIPSGFARI